MKKGDKVRFKEPTEEEKGLIFEIIEDRDNRVLVSAIGLFDSWEIKPTSAYLKSDLELVADAGLKPTR